MWLCVKFRLQEYYIFSLLLPKQCKFTIGKKKKKKYKLQIEKKKIPNLKIPFVTTFVNTFTELAVLLFDFRLNDLLEVSLDGENSCALYWFYAMVPSYKTIVQYHNQHLY